MPYDPVKYGQQYDAIVAVVRKECAGIYPGGVPEREMRDEIEEQVGIKRSTIRTRLNELVKAGQLKGGEANYFGRTACVYSVPDCDGGETAPEAQPALPPTTNDAINSQATDDNIRRLRGLLAALTVNERAVLDALDDDGDRQPFTARETLDQVFPQIRSETTVRKILDSLTAQGFLEHWHCDDGVGCGLKKDDQYLWCTSEAYTHLNSELDEDNESPVEAGQPAPAPEAPLEPVVATGEPETSLEAKIAAMIAEATAMAVQAERERAERAEAHAAELEAKLASLREVLA